jgi:hypothetical protein
MTILVGLFSILFTRVLGRWRGALIAILGISLYTLLVGAQASVVRAAGDREGRPDPEALEAVEGHILLRTDQDGWIELISDGEQLWVEVEKR